MTLFYEVLITRQINNDAHKILICYTAFKQYPWPVKVHQLNNFARVPFGVCADESTVNLTILFILFNCLKQIYPQNGHTIKVLNF